MPPSKLTTAHERAARVASLSGGSLLLGLSGKDSFASLAIASEHFNRIVCFYMYLVKGVRCIETPLEAMCRRYKAELIYVPHFDLSRLFKHSVLRPLNFKRWDKPDMKKGDVERLARVRSGIDWLCYGEKLSDSFARRLFWRKIDGIYEKGKRCTFIMEWLDRDVVSYLKAIKAPQPCLLGSAQRSTGFELSVECLSWLKQHHPGDYAQVLKVFPYAEAQLMERDNVEKRTEDTEGPEDQQD